MDGMTIFRTFTLHVLAIWWQEFCDALMEAFHHRLWKKSYTAVIRPRIWSAGPTQRLQRLQDSFSKRHGIMLPPLQKRFDYHTLVLLYRIREKLAPDQFCSHYFFPPSYIEHIWLFAQKALLSCPQALQKNLPLSIAFCPEQSLEHTPLWCSII